MCVWGAGGGGGGGGGVMDFFLFLSLGLKVAQVGVYITTHVPEWMTS